MALKTPAEDDYLFLPLEHAVGPAQAGYFEHEVDAWWVVRPGKGLVFYNPLCNRQTGRRRHRFLGSPQCNTDERVTRGMVRDGIYPFTVEVQQVPSAWVQCSPAEYVL